MLRVLPVGKVYKGNTYRNLEVKVTTMTTMSYGLGSTFFYITVEGNVEVLCRSWFMTEMASAAVTETFTVVHGFVQSFTSTVGIPPLRNHQH